MSQFSIAEQAEKYAEVIVGQIEGNFTSLNQYVEAHKEVKKARKKFRETLPSNTNGKDFVEKVIDKFFSKSPNIIKLLEADAARKDAEEKRKSILPMNPSQLDSLVSGAQVKPIN